MASHLLDVIDRPPRPEGVELLWLIETLQQRPLAGRVGQVPEEAPEFLPRLHELALHSLLHPPGTEGVDLIGHVPTSCGGAARESRLVQGIPTRVLTGRPTMSSRPSASDRPSYRRRRPATRRRSAPACIIRRSCVAVHTPPCGGSRLAAPRRPHIVTASCAPRRPHSYAALHRRVGIGWREHGRVDRLGAARESSMRIFGAVRCAGGILCDFTPCSRRACTRPAAGPCRGCGRDGGDGG